MREERLFVWNLVSSLEKSMSSAFGLVKKVDKFSTFAKMYVVLRKGDAFAFSNHWFLLNQCGLGAGLNIDLKHFEYISPPI